MTDLRLVVGSGSIARRHLQNLKIAFPEAQTGCVAASGRRLREGEVQADHLYGTMDEAIAAAPLWAIVASPATLHLAQTELLLTANIPVLIEKPLAVSAAGVEDLLGGHADQIAVGYHLRAMPSLALLKEKIDAGTVGKVQSVFAEVGQYLPDWRPDTDYRQGVSAQRSLGGGALLELSHELDYLTWIFGMPRSVFSIERHSGTLEIDVEDQVDALMVTEQGAVIQLHLDFLQRQPARGCKVIGAEGTLVWDCLANALSLQSQSGTTQLFSDPAFERNRMYIDEIVGFDNFVGGRAPPVVSLQHGLTVMRLIDALRQSAATHMPVLLGDSC